MIEEFKRRLPDWVIRREKVASGTPKTGPETAVWVDEPGCLRLSRIGDGPDYRLRFSDQIAVDVHIDRRVIVERALLPGIPQSTCDHFLVDQVLPRMLGHNGELVLHAAAVRVGDGAVILVGRSGSGKSTLGASFERDGRSLLGDDTAVVFWLDGVAHVRAVYSSLRLFPDSIEALFSRDVVTAAVAHYTPKLRITVPLKTGSESGAFPIRAMFMLGASAEDAEAHAQPMSVANSCMALVENSFVLDPSDTTRAPRRLHKASRLAREVPAFALSYPRSYSSLAAVRAVILATLPASA